jgi:putative spermidine/putrescine transport system permease protein
MSSADATSHLGRNGFRVAFACLILVAACFLLLPILVIVPISFTSAQYLAFPPPGFSLQWYEELLTRPEWSRALWVSLRVGTLSAALSLILGIAAAIALTRTRFRGKTLVYFLILSPTIIPTVVIGLGVFFLFSKLHLTGTTLGIALGHTVVFSPIVVIIVSSGLQSFDTRIEQAAIILGASPLRAFLQITTRSIAPSIVSAGLFAFLLSFDEVMVSLFLADPATVTLPIQIWNNAILQISPVIAAVSVLLMVVTLLILALARVMRRSAISTTKRTQ